MKAKNLFFIPALIAVLNLTPAGPVTAQTFMTLHNFSGSDGANPYAGLITNSSANTLYGTAAYGGSGEVGTVFAVNTDGSGFTTLHDFDYVNDRANPYAGLILSGNTLYGTASEGGNFDEGTVFSVNTGGTGFTTLHSFQGSYRFCLSDFDCPCGFQCFDSTCLRQVFCNGDTRDTEGQKPYAGLILSGNTL